MAENGRLSDRELSPIFNGGGPRVQLSHRAAAAWNSLALDESTVMRVNGKDSAYRAFERQQFWRNFWCNQGDCGKAAVPGTSNHGLGNAADVQTATQSSIRRFGKRCSWDKIEAFGEEWHFNYVGGFERPDPGPDPANPVLSHGSGGFGQERFVKRVQERLKLHGSNPGATDGEFGDNTRREVKQFQREKNLEDDGKVGRETWRHLRHKPEATDEEIELADKVHACRRQLAEQRGEDTTAVSRPDPVRHDKDTLRELLEACRGELV